MSRTYIWTIVALLLVLSMPAKTADTCMEAVQAAIRGAKEINDEWYAVCLEAAPDHLEVCRKVHAIYNAIIQRHRR